MTTEVTAFCYCQSSRNRAQRQKLVLHPGQTVQTEAREAEIKFEIAEHVISAIGNCHTKTRRHLSFGLQQQ